MDSLKENYISKAKAVSYIIDRVPDTEEDIAELVHIASLMSIDEIHIFDQNGRIYGGTIPSYYGYTFDSGEQMAYFKPMLGNRALSMCQDVTPNTAEGKAMMYAICWNDAGTRMTQIGIEPKRLLEEMRTNQIAEVIGGMPAYDGIEILVADLDSGEILGSTMPHEVGSSLSEIGLKPANLDFSSGICNFDAVVLRQPSYCSAAKAENFVIVIAQECAEVNRDIPFIMLMVLLYLLLAAGAITLIVRRMTAHIIAEHNNANTDAMTGFFNRRAYETELKRLAEGERAAELVYISADLNGLKAANDSFGHEAGDELICGAAECLRATFGRRGKLYRIGGDEFVALISADEAQLAELRQTYENSLRVWSERHGSALSTACGYVRAAEFPEKSMAELAKLADERMYAAKAAYYQSVGKDRRKR